MPTSDISECWQPSRLSLRGPGSHLLSRPPDFSPHASLTEAMTVTVNTGSSITGEIQWHGSLWSSSRNSHNTHVRWLTACSGGNLCMQHYQNSVWLLIVKKRVLSQAWHLTSSCQVYWSHYHPCSNSCISKANLSLCHLQSCLWKEWRIRSSPKMTACLTPVISALLPGC